MPRNHFFWLFLIATTMVFSNTSRADNHVKPDEQRLNNYIMQRLDYLLNRSAKAWSSVITWTRQLLINLNDRSSNRSRSS